MNAKRKSLGNSLFERKSGVIAAESDAKCKRVGHAGSKIS